MAEQPKSRLGVVTTALDLAGAVLLTTAGYLALGAAAALAIAGGFCLGLSYAMTRRGSA